MIRLLSHGSCRGGCAGEAAAAHAQREQRPGRVTQCAPSTRVRAPSVARCRCVPAAAMPRSDRTARASYHTHDRPSSIVQGITTKNKAIYHDGTLLLQTDTQQRGSRPTQGFRKRGSHCPRMRGPGGSVWSEHGSA